MNILKSYNQFIKENRYIELSEEHGSLGQYIEKIETLFSNDIDTDRLYRFRQIIAKYINKEVDPYIKISNTINVLDDIDQRLLVKEIQREFNINLNLKENLDIDINTDTNIEEVEKVKSDIDEIKDMRLSGKFGFNSFLKVITALNLPNIEPDHENCPRDFSIIYTFLNIDKDRLVNIMNRFRSLTFATKLVNDDKDNRIGLYFGLKYNRQLTMEYGLIINDKKTMCGEFNFNEGQLNKIMNNNTKSLNSFKENIKGFNLKKVVTLMKVKKDLDTFSPGYFHKKSNPKIIGDVLTIAYYGVGIWDDGVLDDNDYNRMKSEFNDWILNQKWKSKVIFSVKPGKFWVYFKIKSK